MDSLIVTSDDAGLSRGINLKIIELYQRGIVTSASVITNFPSAGHALELFARHPGLQVGVHLNLTEGFPLTRIETPSELTFANGRFRSASSLYARSLVPGPRLLALVEQELAAQVDVVLQAGVEPQHLTTHMQFHSIPSLRNIVSRLAGKYRVPWTRTYRLREIVLPVNPFFERKPTPRSPPEKHDPRYLAVVLYWLGTRPERLAESLSVLPGTVELVVHPCTEHDDSFPKDVSYLPEGRFKEMTYLEKLWPLISKPPIEGAD